MNSIFRVARKEYASFFSSPVAYIFLGVFLAVNLFVFFWVETFFAANLSEMRPLFKWMPILLIFLSSAVTMRQWAEERRAGTLELLLTAPVSPVSLVLGKFLACLGLVITALLLTLPLPLTVSLMGPLDWGPVIGGYLATIFLAGAYLAIGLFVSARSDNQIVSLIVASLVCGLFYLIGSDTLAGFVGNSASEMLHLLGSGSRFTSITRGVIDLRDLCYYLSIMAVFLSFNVYGLERIRWADNPTSNKHQRVRIACGLLVLNFIVVNFWLAPLTSLRLDLTKGKIYSISETTKNYLSQLREPLLIRGYFSPQTHPLLAPLVPQLRDLLEEYAVAGDGRVQVEFIDPQQHPELEQEAGQKYGIRPVPFQTSSKYQASVTNSYFDVLIQYGDQFEVLGFRDLIEVKGGANQEMQVALRNPEYDLTRAIKKVLYSFQGGGNILADIGKPVKFTGYISAAKALPEELVTARGELQKVLDELQQKGGDLFSSQILDPDSDGGKLAETLRQEFGFTPMMASLFDNRTFWFYMTLTSGERTVEVMLPQEFDHDSLQRAINDGLKRFSAGVAKTVALNLPPTTPPMPQYGMPGRGPQFNYLKELLGREHLITEADLKKGYVPGEADMLIVVAPEALDEKQLFAIDQFLMQGGTVVLASSAYDVNMQQQLNLEKKDSGLADWLKFQGITVADKLVLDPQNSSFPVPVQRQVAGFTIQETQLVNYPFFVDVRQEGMDQKSGLFSGLNELTMNWSSPVSVDEDKVKGRTVTRLLTSTDESWLTSAMNIQPDFDRYGELGFAQEDEKGSQLLGVMIEGSFTSYFAGKPSPLLTKDATPEAAPQLGAPDEAASKKQVISRQLDKSPESARIILFASNSFLNDTMLSVGSSVRGSNYLAPVQLMANAIDWSLEDRGLLEIRGRGHFSRTLYPMGRQIQMFWEYLNYALALGGLVVVWAVNRTVRRRATERYLAILQ